MKGRNVLLILLSLLTICASTVFGAVGGYVGSKYIGNDNIGQTLQNITNSNVEIVNEESAVTKVAEDAKDSVVSIIISKELPKYETYLDDSPDSFWFNLPKRRQIGTEEQQIGAGTGFIISEDGLIVTNKHVASEEDALYTVLFNDGSKKEAKVLAKDTLLDIAFMKIEGSGYKPLKLGSSADLKVGQSVVAIGNALGEFSNTVSTGVISGLKRNIMAGDQNGGSTEALNDVIQTDASINFGNSGGPLFDIKGNVIGVNVAIAGDAENIGFAIPIDLVKDLIERFNRDGAINRPVLGVRYTLIDKDFQTQNKIPYDYGAYISSNTETKEVGVIPGSPADKAGLKTGDIILEVGGEKITENTPLQSLIQKRNIGDTVQLKIYTGGQEKTIDVVLEKFEV
jgi:serine protease Do